ncbi:hypothetical protein KP509_19G016600 [Ceratopteris richardii]|nr:hypothetical protein KP509_19G016600 [Ceratopteris richardii]
MYAKCGTLQKAEEVFHQNGACDPVSWNTLIAGYLQHDCVDKAVGCFKQMQLQSVPPDSFTYSCILKACGIMKNLHFGSEMHIDIEKKGLLENSPFVGNALIDMYSKCGSLQHAHQVFNMLPVHNVVTWTSVIAGYLQQEKAVEALKCFEQMLSQGVSPDGATIVCCLKACGSIAAKEKGQELHQYAKEMGFLEHNILVATALVDMYMKCGMVCKALEVFISLHTHNIITWNSLIAGLAQWKCDEVALGCYDRMKLESVCPDVATLTCSLKACGDIIATKKGRQLHAVMELEGFLKASQLAGNSLVDMYAKAGMLESAERVFNELPIRNVVSWNAMITGYARLGRVQELFSTSTRMINEGITVNSVTCLSVLTGCSHNGLVDQAQTYFQIMSESFGFHPTLEHYACFIDLLGRAGQLEGAYTVLLKAPSYLTNLAMWLTLLSTCRKWGNIELGRQVFKQAVRIHRKEGALYTCMSKIYGDAGLWSDMKHMTQIGMRMQALN